MIKNGAKLVQLDMTKLSAHQPYSSCKVLVIKKNPTIHIIYTNVQILIKLKCNFKTIALISFKLELYMKITEFVIRFRLEQMTC